MDKFTRNTDKKTVFRTVRKFLKTDGLNIKETDETRPWGGFFVIDDSSLSTFIERFFSDDDLKKMSENQALSPKVLLVEPGKRLSWQYHHRRSEIWSVIGGTVGIILSSDDHQKKVQTFTTGSQIAIEKGERHRLVGLDEWGIVAEIWKHTDPSNPSDENDIVRLEDDFGR